MIELRPPDDLDKCSVCRARPESDRFCDLVEVDWGNQVFTLCHDCAHELIEKLLGRFYALWGQALMPSDAVEAENEACALIAENRRANAIFVQAYRDGFDDAAKDIAAAIRARGVEDGDEQGA